MPRNIEIKARIDSVEALFSRARALAEDPPQVIEQDDTFFPCTHGRLKLRDFGDGCGELIHYERADAEGPTRSDYIRAPTSDTAALRDALTRLELEVVLREGRHEEEGAAIPDALCARLGVAPSQRLAGAHLDLFGARA